MTSEQSQRPVTSEGTSPAPVPQQLEAGAARFFGALSGTPADEQPDRIIGTATI
jgi:hypothetical protein